MVYEHFHRYLWAARLVQGRQVLDLGSGEGFGAAILAETAEHVVGVDLDEPTVVHSQLNYGGADLEFRLGTAVDLSEFADSSFGAIVAFEVIEHVRDQERVLSEVARVLSDDGILLMSTPDRRMYAVSRDEPNPFHERELTSDEFLSLLESEFPHVAQWGQRTITGSHLSRVASPHGDQRPPLASEFFIERAGDTWQTAAAPAALYCIAVASRAPLPELPSSSTLADCDVQLVRDKEHQTAIERCEVARLEAERASVERDRQHAIDSLARERDTLAQEIQVRQEKWRQDRARLDQRVRGADEDIDRSDVLLAQSAHRMVELQAHIDLLEAQLATATQLTHRIEESVSWQSFQRMRAKLYAAVGGEHALVARAVGASLRVVGRTTMRRVSSTPAMPLQTASEVRLEPEVLKFPQPAEPEVSLIIPLYARADLTRACLRTIRDHTSRISYEVVIVDDGADEETQALLREIAGARIIHNQQNIGYLRSVNAGASAARGKWYVLFNNDTEVTRGWLEAMLDCAMSSPDIGVVTPKFVFPDGRLNEAGGIIWKDGTGMNYGRGDAPNLCQYEYRRETDYGSAAALMVTSALWKEVGGFDERYVPMYYEDADLCFEARERGLRVVYEPAAVVVHVEGATAGNDVSTGPKRYQERNRPKFVEKWRHRLDLEHGNPTHVNYHAFADRRREPHVLIVDHRVPMWDRDAGSLRVVKMMASLLDLGARVSFMPENLAAVKPYTRGLQEMGVEVICGHVDPRAQLERLGQTLSTVILCRPHPASRWLDTVRELAPRAAVAYDTVDLHWMREARKSIVGAPSAGIVAQEGTVDAKTIPAKAKALRELELAMIRATDTTIVVSDRERDHVQRDVPAAQVIVVPTVHDLAAQVPPSDLRSGILFVGGFEHAPNVDAALWLITEVMPTVWEELGDIRVTIVGSQPPAEVQALASLRVDVTGWVADLQPLLDSSRLMVAPLRYGAGMKGKITQALAVGLPVVTTSIGAEGLDGHDEECFRVADDPTGLANQAIAVYRDDDLWLRLSQAGQRLVRDRCSTQVMTERLGQLIATPTSGRALPLVGDGTRRA